MFENGKKNTVKMSEIRAKYMKPERFVIIVTNQDNKMLLCKNRIDGSYKLPGATVNSFEGILNAAIKTLEERTGIKADPDDVYYIFDCVHARNTDMSDIAVFHYKYTECDCHMKNTGKEYGWFQHLPHDSLLTEPEVIKEVFAMYLRGKQVLKQFTE